MCLGAHCSELEGRPEHLDRTPIHPIEVEGSIYNITHQQLWSQRIPAFTGELPRLPGLLYTVSLSFVVQKVALYRNGLCVGCMCCVVLAAQLDPVGHLWCLGCWLARLEQLWERRPGVCGGVTVDTAWSLCSELKWALGSAAGNTPQWSCRWARCTHLSCQDGGGHKY